MKNLKSCLKIIFFILPVIIVSCSIVDNQDKGGRKGDPLNKTSVYADNYTPGPGYAQIWNDEFNGPNLDQTKWQIETGHNFGNQELDECTDSPNNIFIENGNLVIQALRQDLNGQPFTSGRLNSYSKFFMRYGKIAAKIKMPYGMGMWPAFWMMGKCYKDNAWPHCGEIDIAEMMCDGAVNDQVVLSTFHWYIYSTNYTGQADYGLKLTNSGRLADDYHVYEMKWDTNLMTILFDGQQVVAMGIGETTSQFAYPFYIIFGMGVGGSFWNPAITSASQVTAPMPQRMTVDWIRVYSNTAVTLPPSPDASQQLQIYSETHTGLNAFSRGGKLNLWASTLTVTPVTTSPAEGAECWKFTVGTAGWAGFGITAPWYGDNLLNYQNSYLMFKMKTTTATSYKVGIDFCNGIIRWVNLTSSVGYVNDGQWHQIRIPLSSISGVDYSMISEYFCLVSTTATTSGDVFYLDDIYWTSKSDVQPPAAGPSGVDLSINSESHTAWNVYSHGASLDVWSGTVTLANDAGAASEGATGWKITVANASWYGMGVSTAAVDLSAYVNSTLNFDIKTSTPRGMQVGVSSADGMTVWVKMDSKVGFVADGNWHSIHIPMTWFQGLDFKAIVQYFMLLNDGPVQVGDVINIDNVYYAAATAPASSSAAPPSSSSVASSSTSSSVPASSSAASVTSVQASIVSATASTTVNGNTAALSFDKNTGTRWESASADPQWIYWDLGSSRTLLSIIIDWETASASNYTIQGSLDAAGWTTLSATTNTKYFVNHTIITNILSGSYRYVRMYGTTRTTGYGYSIWEASIFVNSANASSSRASSIPSSAASSSAPDVLLTISNAAASTVLGGNTAAMSFDKNAGTRWESAQGSDPQWIYWDLGASKALSKIIINWEVASASNYTIQGSADTVSWTTLAATVNSKATDHLMLTNNLSGNFRYVRMYGTTRATIWGYSIWEASIYSH